MGNQQCLCCEQAENTQKNELPSMINVTSTQKKQQIRPPKLSSQITKHLQYHQPFINELESFGNRQFVKFGEDIFEGKLNYKNKPQGYGKMYYKNGSLFIGQFQNGIANGPGQYIFPDGSYYKGTMQNNKAEGTGQFFEQSFQYKGEFKNNRFEGLGQQKNHQYEFKGKYKNNNRIEGQLIWFQKQYNSKGQVIGKKERKYNGSFNQMGKFHGFGVLSNQFGVYKGEFCDGVKNGKGEFQYLVGIRYVGQYNHDVKEGQGVIYSKTGAVAFCGEMKNGLPHGKGYVTNNYGDKVHLNWINGLDERLLESKKQTGSTGTTGQSN